MEIGPYELLGEVARGSMGVVYRARGPDGAEVALKLLLAQAEQDPEDLARFRTEADVLGRLQHPGIVRVLDAGSDAGRAYLVMELLEGESLDARLRRRGALSPRRAAWIGHELSLALAHAHDQRVIHRDLKPANIFLTRSGDPVLLDFGLAHVRGGALTASGDLLGTPLFMAPEQAAGDRRRIGPATDVYGVGAVLYRCLAGRPPFAAQSLNGVLEAIMHHSPRPLGTYCSDLPEGLEQVVMRCLLKEPEERYSSATQLASELAPFIEGAGDTGNWKMARPGEHPVSKRAPTRRYWPAGVAVALGAAVLGGVAGALLRRGEGASSSPPTTPESAVVSPTGLPAPTEVPVPTSSRSPGGAADDLLERAHDRRASGDLRGALKLAERALLEDAEHVTAHALYAGLLYEVDDFPGARREADWVLAREPDHTDALLIRARVVAPRGDFRGALRALDRILELEPNHAGARIERVRIYFTQGDTSRAQQELEEAARRCPDNLEVWELLGGIAMELGDLERALEASGRLVELAPDDSRGYFTRGTARNMSGDSRRALEDFDRAIELDPKQAIHYVHRAIVHGDLDDLESALADLNHALELDPSESHTLINRAQVYMGRRAPGDQERALADFERALSLLDPRDPYNRSLEQAIEQLRRELGR